MNNSYLKMRITSKLKVRMLKELFLIIATFFTFASHAQRRIDAYRIDAPRINQFVMGSNEVELFRGDLSCEFADACIFRSAGFGVTINYQNPNPAYQNAPPVLKLEIWEGNVRREVLDFSLPAESSTVVGGRTLLNQLSITPSSNVYVKYIATTKALGSGINWPTFVQVLPKYGIGLESIDKQNPPAVPNLNIFTFDAKNNSYNTEVQITKRTDSSYLDGLEIAYFSVRNRRIKVDVDMTKFKKIISYDTPTTSNHNVYSLSGVGALARFSVQYPSSGYYRTEFKGIDQEKKESALAAKTVKHLAFRAPTTLVPSVNGTTRQISITWTKPKKYTDGSIISSSSSKGYLIYLRNPTTKKVLFSYNALGYNTQSFVTPNAITIGSYELLVCGWSTEMAEGTCGTSSVVNVK